MTDQEKSRGGGITGLVMTGFFNQFEKINHCWFCRCTVDSNSDEGLISSMSSNF